MLSSVCSSLCSHLSIHRLVFYDAYRTDCPIHVSPTAERGQSRDSSPRLPMRFLARASLRLACRLSLVRACCLA